MKIVDELNHITISEKKLTKTQMGIMKDIETDGFFVLSHGLENRERHFKAIRALEKDGLVTTTTEAEKDRRPANKNFGGSKRTVHLSLIVKLKDKK